ncbi:diguanylate cyclase [Halofilum ochraceum]|uniref:diguanylate cyclase n=1 Tax=Halofilum ochraceum TaxID=1611323 RepID=UPI0008DAFFEA|nr:diguanylate cyclase [Halofilum ochraceum]
MSRVESNTPPRRKAGTDLTVADVMSADMLACTPDTPVAEAARRMSAARCSSIIVREGDDVLGIWTERDALSEDCVTADGTAIPIRDVMNAPVLTLPGGTTIGDAATRFKQRGIRHFLVVDARKRPIGIISQSDVVLNHGVEWFMRLQRVSSVLGDPPPMVAPHDPLSAATAVMRRDGRDAVAMETGAGDFAILTERDVLRQVATAGMDASCLHAATRPMQTVSEEDSLFNARNHMLAGSFRHIGVVDRAGRLTGLIGFGEIMQTIEHGYVEELEVALRERDSALRASEERYRSLVEASPDAIAVHRDRRILFINPAGARLLGAESASEVLGASFDDFLADADMDTASERLIVLEREVRSQPTEERFVRLDGLGMDVELRAMPITYNDEPAWQIVMSDITRRKEIEAELRRLASTDQLTGIHNRPHFEQHLDHELREASRFDQPVSLIMFDLNGFKRINDSLGHDAGDRALQTVANTIASYLRDTDLFARWGGDEFMILAPRTDPEGAWRLCTKLAHGLATTMASPLGPVGAAFALTGFEPDEQRRSLLKRLDLGVYRAKELDHDGLNGIARV